MVIQNLDYPNFQAFRRLIAMKLVNGGISKPELDYMTFLATEHGISKEDVEELMDLLEIKSTV
ncbi:MAG: hypothetical protein RIC35_04640 [Marinoscillum sp.]